MCGRANSPCCGTNEGRGLLHEYMYVFIRSGLEIWPEDGQITRAREDRRMATKALPPKSRNAAIGR